MNLLMINRKIVSRDCFSFYLPSRISNLINGGQDIELHEISDIVGVTPAYCMNESVSELRQLCL